jgi:hypothetical protein
MDRACSMHETNQKYKTFIVIAEGNRRLGRNRRMWEILLKLTYYILWDIPPCRPLKIYRLSEKAFWLLCCGFLFRLLSSLVG